MTIKAFKPMCVQRISAFCAEDRNNGSEEMHAFPTR